MPGTIILPRKETFFENPLLRSVFMTSLQEGLRRKRETRQNERADIKLKEKQAFDVDMALFEADGQKVKEGTEVPENRSVREFKGTKYSFPKSQKQQLADKGIYLLNGKPHKFDGQNLVPVDPERPYKIGTIKDFKEGDKFVQKKYTKDGFVPTGKTAKRYKPTTVVNVQDSIRNQAEKDFAKTKTYLHSSNLKTDVMKDLPKIDAEAWSLSEGVPHERNALIKKEMDVRIKSTYRDAVFGDGDEGKGWYVKRGNKHKLVSPWIESDDF